MAQIQRGARGAQVELTNPTREVGRWVPWQPRLWQNAVAADRDVQTWAGLPVLNTCENIDLERVNGRM